MDVWPAVVWLVTFLYVIYVITYMLLYHLPQMKNLVFILQIELKCHFYIVLNKIKETKKPLITAQD